METKVYLGQVGSKLTGKLLQQIGETLSGGVVCCYLQKGYPYFYLNNHFLNMLGDTYEEFAVRSEGLIAKVIYPEDREPAVAQIERALAQGGDYRAEYRMVKNDGSLIWVRDVGKRTISEDGKPVIISVYIDITESMELRKELEEKSQELTGIVEALPCGVCKIKQDSDFSIIYASRFFYGIFGYTPEDAEKAGFTNMRFIIAPSDYSEVQYVVSSHIREKCFLFELEHSCVHKTGETMCMLSRCSYDPADKDCITAVLINITYRKRVEEALRISEEQYRIAMQQTEKQIDVYELATRTLVQPQQAAEEFLLPPIVTDVPYSIVERGIVADESVGEYIRFFESILRGNSEGCVAVRMKNYTGRLRWYQLQYTMIYKKDSVPHKAIISYEDVTQRREKEIAYQKWSQYFDTQQADSIGYYEYNLTQGLYEKSEGEVTEDIPEDVKPFTGAADYIANHFIYAKDREEYLRIFNREMLLAKYYSGQREVRLEHRRLNSSGEVFWALGIIQLLADPYTDDIKAFALIKNIDTEKKENLNLQRCSERDALTGLLNRRAIVGRIDNVLKNGGDLVKHAVLMLDIDNFKKLNDTYGHQFGDQVLVDVSQALKSALRQKDFCGRLGGDEFIVFLYDITEDNNMESRLEEFCRLLQKNYVCGASVSGSVGLAFYPRDGKRFEELYEKADIALYMAKKSGRNRYAIFQTKPDEPDESEQN